jgi:hypothetical protein
MHCDTIDLSSGGEASRNALLSHNDAEQWRTQQHHSARGTSRVQVQLWLEQRIAFYQYTPQCSRAVL